MKTSRPRMWGEAIAAIAGAVGCIVTARRFNGLGATSDEASRSLPGDDEVALPSVASTRAVAINAPADAVLRDRSMRRECCDSSWLFLLEPVEPENLIKGNRHTYLGALASTRFAGFGWALGDFVMAHRHMNGIKRRAEREWRTMRSSQQVATRT